MYGALRPPKERVNLIADHCKKFALQAIFEGKIDKQN